jgi:hypothetical protein
LFVISSLLIAAPEMSRRSTTGSGCKAPSLITRIGPICSVT